MNDASEVVVITGASAGVGRATARRFAKDGAQIALLARGRDGLEAARKEVEEFGGRAIVLMVDVADADEVEAAAAQIERELGEIDIWINNAMASVFSPIQEMTPEEFRRVTEVTYLGCVHGTLAALKRMLPRNRGMIVQVGSALSYRAIPLQSAYCAAKHAMRGFTDSLRCELLHQKSKVRVTMVQLPALNTPQFGWVKSRLPRKAQPVPPIFQPEVAAEAIHFAACHPRREFYVGWPSVQAIVANKFIPGFDPREAGFQHVHIAGERHVDAALVGKIQHEHLIQWIRCAREIVERAMVDKSTLRLARAFCRDRCARRRDSVFRNRVKIDIVLRTAFY